MQNIKSEDKSLYVQYVCMYVCMYVRMYVSVVVYVITAAMVSLNTLSISSGFMFFISSGSPGMLPSKPDGPVNVCMSMYVCIEVNNNRRISLCIVKHQPPAAANISSRSFSEGTPLFPIMYVCINNNNVYVFDIRALISLS